MKTLNKQNFFIFLLLISFNSSILNSHHAFTAEFDANAPINITGKVVKAVSYTHLTLPTKRIV